MYRINEFLTPEERLEAIRIGAMKKLASLGMTPSDFDREMEKSAQAAEAVSDVFSAGNYIKLALLLGVPLGTLTYAFGSMASPNRKRNRKLKHGLDQFNDIAEEYRRNSLPQDGSREEYL